MESSTDIKQTQRRITDIIRDGGVLLAEGAWFSKTGWRTVTFSIGQHITAVGAPSYSVWQGGRCRVYRSCLQAAQAFTRHVGLNKAVEAVDCFLEDAAT